MYVPMILNKFTSAPEIVVPIIVIRQYDYVHVYYRYANNQRGKNRGGVGDRTPTKIYAM